MDVRSCQLPRLPPHVERSQTESTQATSASLQSTQTNGSTATTQQPSSDGYVVPGLPSTSGATFGVDLGEQLSRDGIEVPKVVEKCAQAIEAFG